MEKEVISFLNENVLWEKIKLCFHKYVKNINEKGPQYVNASIVLRLSYNYSILANVSQRLLHFIISDPRNYEHIILDVVFKAVNSQLEAVSQPYKVQIEQIHCIHRFEGLPLTKHYKFYPKIKTSLSNLTCIVATRSEVKMYIRHTVWYCDAIQVNSKCNSKAIADEVPKCENCLQNMKEYVELRDMSSHVKLSVYPLEMAQTPKCVGRMYHKLDVILRDELTKFNIMHGRAYIITGIYDGIKKAFYAWNIVEKKDI